jgi:hypothetical protein
VWLVEGWGHVEICKLLLKVGADVNARDRDGLTAADVAKNSTQYPGLAKAFPPSSLDLVTQYYQSS